MIYIACLELTSRAQIIDEFRSEGVSTSGITQVQGGDSPFSFIHVDDKTGDRTIFHRPGAGLVWDSSYSLARIGEADALIVDDIYPDLAIVGRERSALMACPWWPT